MWSSCATKASGSRWATSGRHGRRSARPSDCGGRNDDGSLPDWLAASVVPAVRRAAVQGCERGGGVQGCGDEDGGDAGGGVGQGKVGTRGQTMKAKTFNFNAA